MCVCLRLVMRKEKESKSQGIKLFYACMVVKVPIIIRLDNVRWELEHYFTTNIITTDKSLN